MGSFLSSRGLCRTARTGIRVGVGSWAGFQRALGSFPVSVGFVPDGRLARQLHVSDGRFIYVARAVSRV